VNEQPDQIPASQQSPIVLHCVEAAGGASTWCDAMDDGLLHGIRSRMGCLVEPLRLGERPKTTACWSRPGCPAPGQGGRGALCPGGWARGSRGTAATAAGLHAGSGTGGAPVSLALLTLHTPCWMPRWSVSLSPPWGPKGGPEPRVQRAPHR